MTAVTIHQRDIITVNLSNPKHNVTARQQRAALRALIKAHRPAVIVVQEGQSNLKAPFLSGYRKYSGRGGVAENAIFVKKDVGVVGSGSHKSVDGKANHWPDRGFVWAQLADGLVVFGTHPNSGIESGGEPRRGEAWDVTRDLHFPQLDKAIELHAINGRVSVFGDFNIDRYADARKGNPQFPRKRFGRLGLAEAGYKGTSLGSRAVDRGFYERDELTLVKAVVLAKTHSRFDHHPVLFRLRFK